MNYQFNFRNECKALDLAISEFENDVVYEMKKSELLNNKPIWNEIFLNYMNVDNRQAQDRDVIYMDEIVEYYMENDTSEMLADMIERYSCKVFLKERLVEEIFYELEEEFKDIINIDMF